ncbi:hypothetical protein [Actinomadura sp. 3N407]|uniref:hypothetical protein n=1 Tax=Actinomadura sp. 3N407 TaxID=3457423 RepID=UPI003FCDFB75
MGGRQDLPIPFWPAVTGAAAAVLISFAATGLWWRASRLRGDAAGRPLPDAVQQVADGPVLRWTLRLAGLGLAAFVAVAALLGPDDRLNPTAGMVYVVFWAGLIPASLLAGPVWRRLNPLRTVHHAIAAWPDAHPKRGRGHIRTEWIAGPPRSACSLSPGWSWWPPTAPLPVSCWPGSPSTRPRTFSAR